MTEVERHNNDVILSDVVYHETYSYIQSILSWASTSIKDELVFLNFMNERYACHSADSNSNMIWMEKQNNACDDSKTGLFYEFFAEFFLGE